MTPIEAWSGVKPSVHHFRVFGCIGYVHISNNQRTKLDDKSLKCVLLRVSDETKAYRLLDANTKKITSRDVVFAEKEGCKWNETTETSGNLPDLNENESSDERREATNT